MRTARRGAVALACTLSLAACSLTDGDRRALSTTPGAAASPSSSSFTPPTVTGKPVSLTFAASGDILAHPQVLAHARKFGGGVYDFTPMFAPVAPWVSKADIAVCQMETPVSADERIWGTAGLVFLAPRSMTKAVKAAGFDGCSFASNHTWDYGLAGMETTRSVLQSAGLKVSGPPSSDGPQEPAVYEVKGVKVANLAYSYTVFNTVETNLNVPDDAPWLRDSVWRIAGVKGILADAEKAKKAGADLVVLSMHWGSEYQTQPTDDQLRIAREVLESPYVDAIVGAHVHKVQPCDTINGKTVFYGMGNFLSNQDPSQSAMFAPETSDGEIVNITFSRDDAGRWTQKSAYLPTKVDLPAGRVIRPAVGAAFTRTQQTNEAIPSCEAEPIIR